MKKEIGEILDIGTKLVAVTTAYSLLMSVLYFDVFFQNVPGNWIGSLTLEDYIAAALDVLPATLTMAVSFVSVMGLVFFVFTYGSFALSGETLWRRSTPLADRLLLSIVSASDAEVTASLTRTRSLGTALIVTILVTFAFLVSVSYFPKYFPDGSFGIYRGLVLCVLTLVFAAVYYVCTAISMTKKIYAVLVALVAFSSMSVAERAEDNKKTSLANVMAFETCGSILIGSPLLYSSRGILILQKGEIVQLLPWNEVKFITNASEKGKKLSCDAGAARGSPWPSYSVGTAK